MATHAQFSQIDVWSLGYLLVTQWLSLVYGIPTPEQFNTLGNLHKEFLAWLATTITAVCLSRLECYLLTQSVGKAESVLLAF
jgi:hypothetical protein